VFTFLSVRFRAFGPSTPDHLEGANPIVPALSLHDGEGQAEASCGHRNRTRAGRVRLVYCLHHDGSAGKERRSNDGIGRGLSTGVHRPLARQTASRGKPSASCGNP
jgi:hypothetical protein